MSPDKTGLRAEHFPRLVKVYHLVAGNPGGIGAKELATHCQVNVRTIYRDIRDLEEAGVPLWQEKHKFGVCSEHFLPPISLTVPEAIQIFLASRLLIQFSRRWSLDVANLFLKLARTVPEALKNEINNTAAWMQGLPSDPRLNKILSDLAQAWISRRKVRITYRSFDAENPDSRVIEPYFIEPAAAGRSSYVIAFCNLKSQIRTFKVERIESVLILDDKYEIPQDFSADAYLSPALGIMVTGQEATGVKLRFSGGLSRIIEESIWHPSQKLNREADGCLVMKISVNETPELTAWILGWGERVEVLEPEHLRNDIRHTIRKMTGVYAGT